MADLTIVLWAWKPRGPRMHKGRITYGPALANAQAKAIRAHLTIPHEIVVVTDHPAHEFDSSLRIVDAAEHFAEHADLGACYRRLKMFAPEAREILGDRIVSIDLDMVVVRDLTPLFTDWYPFRIWRSESLAGQPYNGSLIAHTAGANPQAWHDFRPPQTIQAARMQGFRGSDQAALAYILGKDQPVWTWQDGVFYLARNCPRDRLPELARIVFSPGGMKVTDPLVQSRYPWIAPLLNRDATPPELEPWAVGNAPEDKQRYYRPHFRRMQEMRQEARRQAIKGR